MDNFIANKYQNDSYSFPNYNIDPEKKGKNYCRRVVEAIYSKYLRNKTGIAYTAISKLEEQRLYGRGEQDTEQYKSQLSSVSSSSSAETVASDIDTGGAWGNKETQRKGWLNVNFDDIFSVMPKIKMALQGNFEGVLRSIVATAIDDKSLEEEEKQKWIAWAEQQYADWFAQQREKNGLPQKKPSFIAEDLDELELYRLQGGFKPNYARIIELLTQHTFKASDWEEIKENLVDDLVDLGVAVVKDEYDSESKRVKIRYCDPLWTVIQYSRGNGFKDSEYAGELKKVSVSKLRTKGFKEETLKDIAKDYSGRLNNPSRSQWEKYDRQSVDGYGWKYDNYKIMVFDVSWIDTDTEKESVYVTKKGGREKTRSLEYNEEPKKGEKLRTTNLRKLYKGSWIVDTEHIYDYGLEYNVPRRNPSEPCLPFHAYKIPTKALTKTLKPLLDQLQLAWLKYQNALAMAVNAGYAIEVGSISNVGLGGGKNDFLKVINMWRDTGVLLYKDRTLLGKRGSAGKPIHEMPGGMGNMLKDSIETFTFNIQLIENLTGISPLAVGAEPQPRTPVGTSEMAIAATAKVLKPILGGIFTIKERVAENALLRIQLGARHDLDMFEGFRGVISKRDWEVLKKAEKQDVMYGIHLDARGTDKEREDLKKAAEVALASGRDGRAGIDLDAYTYILERLANDGNLKEIRMYLSSLIKKSKRRIREDAERAQIIEAKKNQALQQQKSQSELQKEQTETMSKRMLEEQKHANKMEEIHAEQTWKYQIEKEKEHI